MADDPQMDQMLRAALRRRPGAAEADAAGGVCLDAETFAAWSSGALSETQGQAIERHLSTCARCQELAAIFVESEPPVSTATLVAFKPRWSFRWIGPIAAAAAASITWLVWPVRPQTVPRKEATTVARAEPDMRPAATPAIPPVAPPAPAGLPPASTPAAPKLERVAPADEAKRLAEAREAPAGAQEKNRDAHDRRLDSGRGATLADAQAASSARPVPPERRADPKLAAAPTQPPSNTVPPPLPGATPAPPPPPPATPPPAAGTVAGGMGQGVGQGAGAGAGRGATTGPPPPAATAPPAGVVGGVVGGVPARTEEVQVRQQPTFRATLDGVAPVVVAEFSSGATGFAERVVGVAGGGGGGAGRGGAGGRGGGGAAAARAANVLPTATQRWRILLSGGVEQSVDAGMSWQTLAQSIRPCTSSPARRRRQRPAGSSAAAASCCSRPTAYSFARVPFQPATELTSIRATSARDATVTTPDGREFVTNDGGTSWRGRE